MRTWMIQPNDSNQTERVPIFPLNQRIDRAVELGNDNELGKIAKNTNRSRSGLVGLIRSLSVLVIWVFGLSVAWVMVDSFMPIPLTPLMAIRVFENLADGKQFIFSKTWVAADLISPHLQAAVLAGEDTRFFEHNGFDFDAIQKAIEHNTRLAEALSAAWWKYDQSTNR